MVQLRSGRSARVSEPAAGKAAAPPRQLGPHPRPQGVGAAITVRCLHCRHEGVLSAAELVAHGLKPDSPIAGFVRRLKCSKCGSGSVLAKRIAQPQPKSAQNRRSA
jgi:hypothetical protein